MKSAIQFTQTVVVPLDVYNRWDSQSNLPQETKLTLLAIGWLPDRRKKPSPIKLKLKLMSDEAKSVILDIKQYVDNYMSETDETGLFLEASLTLNRFVKTQTQLTFGDYENVQAYL